MKIDLCDSDWPLDVLPADMLDRVSVTVRPLYVSLVSKLGEGRVDDIDWWVTSMAARNTYACPLYKKLCQLMLVMEVHSSTINVTEVVTDSKSLADLLQVLLGTSVKVSVKGRRVSNLKGFLYNFSSSLYHVVSQYVLSKLLLTKRSALPDSPVLLDIFFTENSFDGGEISDRYYPGLMAFLSDEQRKNVLYTPSYYRVRNYYKFYKKLNLYNEQVLLKENVLTLSDYIFALLHPFRLKWPCLQVDFQGVDVAELVKESLGKTFSNSSAVEGLLRYRFARRLKLNGVRPARVIEWFENQEVDHGAVAGWRKYFPELEVIGYQGYLSSPHYLSSFPTAQEQEYSLLPTQVVVIGTNLVDKLKEFSPDLNVTVGPAYRFSSLWFEPEVSAKDKGLSVLVALPIHQKESSNIVKLLVAALGVNDDREDYRFFVKPHPTWKRRDVDLLFLGVNIKYELLIGDFESALAISDVVVSAASSTCSYAIARGIPCIVVGFPGQLLENTIHEDADKRLWRISYTPESLRQALGDYSQLTVEGKEVLRGVGSTFKSEQFNPVTKNAVFEFLGFTDKELDS